MVIILCNQLCTLAITIHSIHILYYRKSSLYKIVFIKEYDRPFILNALNYGGVFSIDFFLVNYELLLYT